MTGHHTDEQLDRLVQRYLAVRQTRTLRVARPAEVAARAGAARLEEPTDRSDRRDGAGRRTGPGRQLVFALVLAGAVGTATVGALTVGGRSSPLQFEPTDEPGVTRLAGDGVHDLGPDPAERRRDLTIAPDGSLWLMREWDDGSDPDHPQPRRALVRLGDPADREPPPGVRDRPQPRVGPDGTLWALQDPGSTVDDDTDRIRLDLVRLEGGPPVVVRTGVDAFDIAPDGTLWAIGRAGAARQVGGRWVAYETPDWVVHDFEDLVAVSADEAYGVARRFDESHVTLVHLQLASEGALTLTPLGLRVAVRIAAAPDGTVWIHDTTDVPGAELAVSRDQRLDQQLSRVRDGAWRTWGEADGVPLMQGGMDDGSLAVDRDGVAWMSRCDGVECSGVVAFDGTTWRHHLDGVHPMDLQAAPDGSVWVVERWWDGRSGRPRLGDLYRIDPAVPAAGDAQGIDGQVITIGELRAGVLAAADLATRDRRLATLTAALAFDPVPVDDDVAAAWARLRITLRDRGLRMPVNDSWIAATALALGIPLVTQDDDHIDLDGLDLIRV